MTTTKDVSLFIADDHVISRMGLKMILEKTDHFKVVGEAEDGEAAIAEISRLKPDVVMMDLEMPKVDGIEATKMIKESLPETRILIFTSAEDDESIFAALKAGADGYCVKNIAEELLTVAIHSVLNGAAWLDPAIAQKVMSAQVSGVKEKDTKEGACAQVTESKLKLLALIESGKSYEEISQELNVNDSLAKGLLNELMAQLQGNTQLASERQPQSTALQVGDNVGDNYKISAVLGFGGMGMVYRAEHQHIDRTVAIKTLHEHLAADQTTLERFKQEAQASSSINHPNLVTIYDYGLLNKKVPYIVMEHLDGVSLEELLTHQGRLAPDTATHIFKQILKALAEVHKHDIVHRDMKPSNIMLITKNGDENFVKLVDFGIAKVLQESSKAKSLTQAGEAMGSPPYMSPEQCYGQKVDFRTDLYSLGCLMYETYTGEKAFIGDTPMDTLLKHIHETAPERPFKEANPAIPNPVQKIVYMLLEREPENRPASADQVHEMIESSLN